MGIDRTLSVARDSFLEEGKATDLSDGQEMTERRRTGESLRQTKHAVQRAKNNAKDIGLAHG